MQTEIAQLLDGRDRFDPELLTPKLEAYVDEQVAALPRHPPCFAVRCRLHLVKNCHILGAFLSGSPEEWCHRGGNESFFAAIFGACSVAVVKCLYGTSSCVYV